jgi:HEAT repeat protein
MALSGSPDVAQLAATGDVNGLIRALRVKDSQIRANAAKALGELGDQRAVEPLIGALAFHTKLSTSIQERMDKLGKTWLTEYRRFEAKDQAQHEGELQKLYEADRAAKEAIGALGRLGGSRAIDSLINSLIVDSAIPSGGWPDLDLEQEVSKALVRFPADDLVPRLIDVLRSRRGRWQEAAILLGKIRDPRALEPLLDALTREPKDSVVHALGELRDPRALQHLVDAFDTVGSAAVNAVARYRGNRALSALVGALGHGDASVRDAAFGRLLRVLIGPDEERPSDMTYSIVADRSLPVPGKAVLRLKELSRRPRWKKGLKELTRLVPEHVDELLKALSVGTPEVRWLAEQLLGAGESRSDDVVDGLVTQLRDQNETVALDAANILSEIGGPRAIEALKGLAIDPGDPSRWVLPRERPAWLRRRRAIALNSLKKLSPETYEEVRATVREANTSRLP